MGSMTTTRIMLGIVAVMMIGVADAAEFPAGDEAAPQTNPMFLPAHEALLNEEVAGNDRRLLFGRFDHATVAWGRQSGVS